MKEFIDVLVFRVNQEPCIENIQNTEEGFKQIVKGKYQFFSNPFTLANICLSLDGEETGLPFNRNVEGFEIYGDFFIASYGGHGLGDFRHEHALMYKHLISNTVDRLSVLNKASRERPYKIYDEKQRALFKRIIKLYKQKSQFGEFTKENIEEMIKPLSKMYDAYKEIYGDNALEEYRKKYDYMDIPAIISSEDMTKFYLGTATMNLLESKKLIEATFFKRNDFFTWSEAVQEQMTDFQKEMGKFCCWLVPPVPLEFKELLVNPPKYIKKVILKARNTYNKEAANLSEVKHTD